MFTLTGFDCIWVFLVGTDPFRRPDAHRSVDIEFAVIHRRGPVFLDFYAGKQRDEEGEKFVVVSLGCFTDESEEKGQQKREEPTMSC